MTTSSQSDDDSPKTDSSPGDDEATSDSGGKAFGRTYWILNSIEAFERLAFFGVRYVVPIYIMQATEPGGLHLTAVHKGWIYMWWSIFQSFLPIITGGYADRYGYKRVLGFAISANVIGYVMMAFLRSYYGFFAGILVLATGTAFFKPSLQGSLAQNLTKKNSSLGWGIFYWVVNVGAFASPFISTIILGKPHSAEGWRNLFLASAGFTCLNLLFLFTFKDVPSGASKDESALQVLARTLRNILEVRLIIWLAIMSCFWLMMYQLWDLHPNFIEDWVDSSKLAEAAPFDSWKEYGDRGLMRVPQQILISANAGLIILLVLPLSWLVRKMRTLSAMLIGMSVATGGILVAGLTNVGSMLLLGILLFSLGEMLTGPKKNEYLGLIAPKGKKGMYLGYVNIPVGVGVGIGSLIAGYVYNQYGEKASLSLQHLGANQHLVAKAARGSDWSDSLDKVVSITKIERAAALGAVQRHLEKDPEATAEVLLATFRNDEGQVVNLAYQYLALHDEFRAKVAEKTGDGQLSDATVGKHIGVLPKATDVSRPDALERVRYLLSLEGKELSQSEIVDMLWQRFGKQPETLTNLALEYLAQGTPVVHDAVSKMTFSDPVVELEEKLGLTRPKAFGALSVALGAEPAEVEATLAAELAAVAEPADRVSVYLMGRKHLRFNAVGRVSWEHEQALLKKLVDADERALATARQMLGAPAGELDYQALAERRGTVQAVLDSKDWTTSPKEAAYLLGLNPFEASALAAAELKDSRLATTRMLWEQYDPQYKVWIPFAVVGVIATIALGVFGQLAKRWKDMDA